MNKDKEHLLKESKSFCMLPWVHIHSTPYGKVAPCCISTSTHNHAIDEKALTFDNRSLMDLVNSEEMKNIRLDMLNGKLNSNCTMCHQQDQQGFNSWRKDNNKAYEQHFDSVMEATNEDGSLNEFKMRYFDIRFNNICNFKCRTCGQEWSSQWEQENKTVQSINYHPNPKLNHKPLLDDVLKNLDGLEAAYFAGGEPLITEEHYILLEEMIRTGNTDIVLKYNSNLSNLNFKDKDLLLLWSYFTKRVELSASIDHYGERAEYIRTGTVWSEVEENLQLVAQIPQINLSISTVLSVFNYLTIDAFYKYLFENIFTESKFNNNLGLFLMEGPRHFACQILPNDYKEKGKASINNAIKLIKEHNPYINTTAFDESLRWVDIASKIEWLKVRPDFKREVRRLDKIRNTSFVETFPELAELLDR